ncbi:MAG: class I SAM-dependent methyltransferase [Anaerolineales bacterium]|nr:class I SAM-dependent methyltransferase [Anaerolineales bacterium]
MNFLRRLAFNFSYFRKPTWDSGITPPELFEFIQTHPAARAIDLGCGTGTNVITLAKTGWQVTGIDFAPLAIQNAKRKIKNAGVEANLFVDDTTQLKNIKTQFELALDIGCFHGVQNKADYLTQLDRILTPSGFWLLYGFFKTEPRPSAPGFVPADFELIASRNLTLLSRKDSFDKKNRPAVWMLWGKQTGKQVDK